MAKYKPYHGPAAPTNEQIQGNNQALAEYLRSQGVRVEETLDPKAPLDSDPVLKICGAYVSYDRWGFVASDDAGCFIDQGDWEQVTNWARQATKNGLKNG